MDATQTARWYFMVLIVVLGLLEGASPLRLADSTVKLEEDMTLNCVCPWGGNLSMVSWTKESRRLAVYHPVHGSAPSAGYEGRVKFLRASPMDGSVSLSNVTDKDAGLYLCSVQTFPQGSWIKRVLVTNASFVHGKPDAELVIGKGDNVTISCKHVGNSTVTFAKLEEKGSQTVAACLKGDGSLVEEGYAERVWVDCSDVLGVTLRLTNVTDEDAGLYGCFFNSDASAHTVLLTVHGEGKGQEVFLPPQHIIYICVGGGTAALVLILVGILLTWWIRRRKQRARVRGKLHPVQKRVQNSYDQAIHDKRKKSPKYQDHSAIYCNIASQPRRTKRRT